MKLNYLNKTSLKTLLTGLFLFGATFTKAQCIANYTYVLGANGSVAFVSTSTGTISGTLYNWTIEGSPAGNAATTTHTFSTNGYKTICLNITNSVTAFCTNTKCDSVLITNATTTTTPCNANYTYLFGANGSVNFASTSTGTSISTNYSWSFGNSSSATGIAPTHVFTSNGTKTVCLTITNSVTGCTSSWCDTLTIFNVTATPCNANYSYALGANGLVSYVSTSTGTTLSTNYSWSFGWGAPNATGISTTRTYTANGYDIVCLTITNSVTGCTSTKCDSVFITNVPTPTPCTANFSYTFGPNGKVSFSSTSSTNFLGTNYSWNFGGSAVGSGVASTHTYTSNGTKTVCLTITNSLTSCSSTKCDTLFISNVGGSVTPCAPSVVYTLSKDSTMALTWNAFPSYPSNVTNATWYWGDGSSTIGLYPSHTYSAAGTYSTCVTVSVSCGTVTATYCYVASIFRSSQSNDMILLNVKQATPTGIKNHTQAQGNITIYPNPSNGEFILDLTGFVNELKENTVSLYNMMGQKVYEKQVLLSDGKQSIDASNLENGTYFVRVNSNNGSLHKKITIQK